MAAALQVLDEAQIELANSLSDFPPKLRCAICSNFAINAFRLPCCEQGICENCQKALPEECPVCGHSPLDPSQCKPNKNLRTTAKVWLKNEEKKRAKEKEKETAAKAVTPLTPTQPDIPLQTNEAVNGTSDQPVQSIETSHEDLDKSHVKSEVVGEDTALVAETAKAGSTSMVRDQTQTSMSAQNDESRPEPTVQSQATTESVEPNAMPRGLDNSQGGQQGEVQGDVNMWNNNGQGQMFQTPFGFDGNQSGFNSMGWNGAAGFNPMMNMQNGISNGMNGNWDYSSMMGMPNNMNMGYMPNAMFGMNGNMGMNGMAGMNGMNMGMNYGSGFGNGWNGQMGSGEFGGANGYYPMGGDYNQNARAQFPHQMPPYAKNNFQNQNRFSGPGGNQKQFGRSQHSSFGDPQNYGQTQTQQDPIQGSNQHGQQDDPFAYQLPADLQSRRPSQQHSISSRQTPGIDARQKTQSIKDEVTMSPKEDKAEDLDTADGRAAPVDSSIQTPSAVPQALPASSTNPGDETQMSGSLTRTAGEHTEESGVKTQDNGDGSELRPIATVDSFDTYDDMHNAPLNPIFNNGMDTSMQPGMMDSYDQGPTQYPDFSHQGPGGARGGFGRGAGFNHRGGAAGRGGINPSAVFLNTGSITVLTPGEPLGVGVAGAPTGPRAMREGRPNTGFSGRAGARPLPVQPAIVPQEAPLSSPPQRPRSKTPERDDNLRTRSKSPSRSRSPARENSRSRSGSRSSSKYRRHKYRERSLTPSSRSDTHERRKDRRYHRTSKHDDYDDRDAARDERYNGDERDSRKGDRSRSASVESSKHRSRRRDKERYRSSRSHRDRSRERRRRHRSRSPIAEERYQDEDNYGAENVDQHGSRRKSRGDRHREKDRDRERDRDRDGEKGRDRDRARSKDRDRDRRRSRRDHSVDAEDDYEDDRHHRSSRRSHKDRERDDYRERERDYDHTHFHAESSRKISPPPPTAPTGPAAEVEFKIVGRSKQGRTGVPPIITAMPPPPSGPRSNQSSFQPPKGPAADRDRRDKDRHRDRDHRRGSNASFPSTPITPTTPAIELKAENGATDPHTLEREARNRERMLREQQRRQGITPSAPTHPSAILSSKRSRDDLEAADASIDGAADEKPFTPPTGPSAQRNKRRKSEKGLGSLLEEAMRKGGGRGGGPGARRRVSVKYEDEENDEQRARRVEREREEGRWH